MKSFWDRMGLLGKVILPVTAIFCLLVGALLLLFWRRSMESAVAAKVESAKETIQQYKSLRGYYTEKVVAKARAHGMKVNFIHEGPGMADTIPLPATMIHELSQRFGQDGKGISLQLYSDLPFPNRASRQLDGYQKDAVERLRKDPKDVVIHSDGRNVRVAIADLMVADACVQCHNTHPLSPKKDWRVGDVRGVLEVKAPLAEDLKRTRATLVTVSWVSGGGLLLCVGLLVMAVRSLLGPIRALSAATRRIVDQGDLSQSVLAESDDEVGQLAGNFNQMIERLRQIPLALNQNVELLAGAVQSLEAATGSQSSTINRQATALQETQVTAEEIRQTSQVASRTAERILADIAKAEDAGEKGTQALEQSLRGLSDILSSVRGTAANIGELGERTRQIGGITSTVKDLADQSNMLALNAAIEAVRSGEHGKGFALVAREIRRLADQSIQSTERVREILDRVQEAVDTAVLGGEDGARRVESNLEQMRASVEHLRGLAAVFTDNSNAVRQIATAVEQQSTGVNQVFAAVLDQNKMMEENLRQLEGTLKAVATLKTVAQSLADVLSRYKV